MLFDKVVCESRKRRRMRSGSGSGRDTESKTRTPHKDVGNKLNWAEFEASHLGGSLWVFKDIVAYRTVDGQEETVIEASGVVHRIILQAVQSVHMCSTKVWISVL